MGKLAKELVNAFLGKRNSVVFAEGNENIYPLRDMVKALLTLTDNDWAMYAYSREPLEGKLSLEDKLEFAYLAKVCGENEASHISTKKSLTYTASEMGFVVNTPDLPNGGANVTFAQYEEDGTITVFMDTVSKAQPVLNELRDLMGNTDIFDVLLLHEMFHGIEQKKADTIYTQTKKIELWRKPFSNRSKIGCLSEIAAMSFAKTVLKLSYNPYIFDVILMYLYNKEAASMLFDEIMDIKENYYADNNIKIS